MWRKQLEAKTVSEKDWAMLGLWSFISSLQYDKAFLFLEKEWHVCVCVCPCTLSHVQLFATL